MTELGLRMLAALGLVLGLVVLGVWIGGGFRK